MNIHRIGTAALFATACGAVLTGCSHAPSDAQLKRLLHSARTAATDPNAQIDAPAVNCLRAWSADVELTATLPPALTDQAGKTTCRQRIDAWIADPTRNPDKLVFEDISSPRAVKREMALLAERTRPIDHLPSANDRPPPMAQKPAVPANPATPIDLMAASAAVDELGQLCQTMKDAVTHGNAPKPVVGFAGYCDKRADQMRARIAAIQQRGSVQQAQMMTVTAQRTLKVAKGIAAQIPQPDSKPAAHP